MFFCFKLNGAVEESAGSDVFFNLSVFFEKFNEKIHLERSDYPRPENIDSKIWEQVKSHLLPHDHVVKKKLDKLFTKKQVNKNACSLLTAGFRFSPPRTICNPVVAFHNDLNGFLIKTFTDEQPYQNGWIQWLARIQGAELIREAITCKGYGEIFKVPHKWIYLIPYNCNQGVGNFFLLVEEDMCIESYEKNRLKWKKQPTKKTLYALYDLLENLGLLDSVYVFNIPYAKDGKIAFIDTEHSLKWMVPYRKLNKALSDENLHYWMTITKQN